MSRIPIEKAAEIRNSIIEFLKNWGVSEEKISIGNQPNYYKHTHKEVIHAEVDDVPFRISLRVRETEQEGGFYSYYWDITFAFFGENPHQLYFTIELETFMSEVAKIFGKRDLEVYNTWFDKTFLIKGNHTYAHVDIFDDELQKMLLNAAKELPKITIGPQGIMVAEDIAFVNIAHILKRVERFVDIGLLLSKNIANWRPPKA